MRLTEILSLDAILVPLKTEDKYEAIKKLVASVGDAGRIDDEAQVLKAVLDREAVMSTGVGDGVAIPHAKSDAAPSLTAGLGITERPVDFESMDKKPVQIIWLLVGPHGATGPHIKALSRISRLMHVDDFRQRLLAAQTSREVFEIISKEEQAVAELRHS